MPTEINAADYAGMTSLYNSTGGPFWLNNQNWDVSSPIPQLASAQPLTAMVMRGCQEVYMAASTSTETAEMI